MFTIETVTGTPYEMGLQHGRIYRHLIEAAAHTDDPERTVAVA